MDHGWPIVVELGLDAVAVADTVIVPAFRGFLDSVPGHDVAEALRAAHGNVARIASISRTGAFALAAAGFARRQTRHHPLVPRVTKLLRPYDLAAAITPACSSWRSRRRPHLGGSR